MKTIYAWLKDGLSKLTIYNGREPLTQEELKGTILQGSFKKKEKHEKPIARNNNHDDGVRG